MLSKKKHTNSVVQDVDLCITLAISEESLHDAQSTKCKILQCKTRNKYIEKNLCNTFFIYQECKERSSILQPVDVKSKGACALMNFV
jgi:hypothetical protein